MIWDLDQETPTSTKLIGNVLEDEKVLGTCHVAFGDKSTFGAALAGVLLEQAEHVVLV